MNVVKGNKVMSAKEAVGRFIADGAVIGLGGQNIGRCAMAIVHEILRQAPKDLTVVGCNLSISMDLMAGWGLIKRTESGTGNLERFGSTYMWRKEVQEGGIEHEDYSHLAMVTRFLAAEMGVPFMPVKSMLGSDLLNYKAKSTGLKYSVIKNPWDEKENVVLVPALSPDVSIVHVSMADELGNLYIDGFTTHEPELIRASKTVIASCEELVSTDRFRENPERTDIPYFFVDAVVVQPGGAYPTSVYRYYDYDKPAIEEYQEAAEKTAKGLVDENLFNRYIEEKILAFNTFDEYLDKVVGYKRLEVLRKVMKGLVR